MRNKLWLWLVIPLAVTACAGHHRKYEKRWVNFTGQERGDGEFRAATYACEAQRNAARDYYFAMHPQQPPAQNGRYVAPYNPMGDLNRNAAANQAGNVAFKNCMGAQGWEEQRVCVSRSCNR